MAKSEQEMYQSHQPGRYAGTQADGPFKNTSTMKPVDQPPCESWQFAQESEYLETYRDKFNNEWVTDRPMHREATAQEGASGRLMFADGSDTAGAKPDDLTGFNVIEYGQGPGFAQNSVVIVDNSRADRGQES